jgi:hypothetical protein
MIDKSIEFAYGDDDLSTAKPETMVSKLPRKLIYK